MKENDMMTELDDYLSIYYLPNYVWDEILDQKSI